MENPGLTAIFSLEFWLLQVLLSTLSVQSVSREKALTRL